jgi:hypothetical protein
MTRYRISWSWKRQRINDLTIEPITPTRSEARRRQKRLNGISLKAAQPLLEKWLAETHEGLSSFRDIEVPLDVDEYTGVRISLLSMATNCLRRLDRINGLHDALEEMTWEETYYWFSKCQGKTRHKGLRAFRILFDQC